MTFLDRYAHETTWQGRAIVMGLYHLAMCRRNNAWTVKGTAHYFKCSVGLASENIRLADAIHRNSKLMEIVTRQDALRKL